MNQQCWTPCLVQRGGFIHTKALCLRNHNGPAGESVSSKKLIYRLEPARGWTSQITPSLSHTYFPVRCSSGPPCPPCSSDSPRSVTPLGTGGIFRFSCVVRITVSQLSLGLRPHLVTTSYCFMHQTSLMREFIVIPYSKTRWRIVLLKQTKTSNGGNVSGRTGRTGSRTLGRSIKAQTEMKSLG